MSPYDYIDEACLNTASMLLSAALLEVSPLATILDRAVHGFTFYCDVAIPGPMAPEALLSVVERPLRRRIAVNATVVLSEMLPQNAAAFLAHVGSGDVEFLETYLSAAGETASPLITIAEIDGEYFVATAPLLPATGQIEGCKLCDAILLEPGCWRISGCAVTQKSFLKTAISAFKTADMREPGRLLAERELAITDDTRTVWLPKGLCWCQSLILWSRSSPIIDAALTPQWVATTPSTTDATDLLASHQKSVAFLRASSLPLPLLVAEAISHDSDLFTLVTTPADAIHWLTSSLQWIEKNYKILGIEYRWVTRFAKPPSARTLSKADWQQRRYWLQAAANAASLTCWEGESLHSQTGPLLEIEAYDRWGARHTVASLVAEVRGLSSCTDALFRCRLFHSVVQLMTLLLEQKAGSLPLWLAPEQLRVLTVSTSDAHYAAAIVAAANARGIRAYLDAAATPLDQKIFQAERAALPHIAIIGVRELQTRTVTMRGKQRRRLSVEELLASLSLELEAAPISNRGVEKST